MGEVVGSVGAGVVLKPRMQVDYMVFFCSPFADKDPEWVLKNVIFAEQSCRDLATKAGVSICASHLFFTRFLHDEDEEERWKGIGGGHVQMRRCDETVLYLPPWRTELSRGMEADRRASEKAKKRVTIVRNERAWMEYIVHLRDRTLSVPLIQIG